MNWWTFAIDVHESQGRQHDDLPGCSFHMGQTEGC